MTRLWNRLRAFLRGPSDDELDRDLADIKRRLADLEAGRVAEAERAGQDSPSFVRMADVLRQRRLRGLEG